MHRQSSHHGQPSHRLRRRVGVLAAALVAALVVLAPVPSASAAPAAPGLRLECSARIGASQGTPVLLVPGTTLTPEEFRWNYMRVFDQQGRGWCAVTLPGNAMQDIQTAGELVASAIRETAARAGRQIAVVGHSQGGMVPRWALKYFPDTRPLVSDLVGLAPSNHGTVAAYPICLPTCAPAIWQQRTTSAFLRALNAGGETVAGISYTQVFTVTDEVVLPNLPVPSASSSSLTTGPGRIRNLPIQQVCPLAVADHLSMGTSDPVGFAAVVDAADHDGPADPARLDRRICLQAITPGIDPIAFPADFAGVVATAGAQLLLAPRVPAEPALRAYAR